MFETILALGIILWFLLSISVSFHAKNHGRSAIIWFFVVAITGVLGVAIYLLDLTSNSGESEGDSHTDKRILKSLPLVIVGSVVGILIGFGLFIFGYLLFPSVTRPEQFYVVMVGMAFIGGSNGPYAYSRLKGRLE